MRSYRLIPLLSVVFATVALCDAYAHAQASTKIAIVNPGKIFRDMRETKAFNEQMEIKRKDLGDQEMAKRKAIDDMIADRKANYNPKHPSYVDISRNIDNAKADLQKWAITTKAEIDRQDKIMVKSLYDKIEAATAMIAQQQGIDLVLSDGRDDITSVEDVSFEQLRQLLNSRGIVYSNKQIDLTDKVLAVLDQQYAAAAKANGGGQVNGPQPAPAHAPPAH